MSFPRTHLAIQRMIEQAVLETKLARAICRKGGLEGLAGRPGRPFRGSHVGFSAAASAISPYNSAYGDRDTNGRLFQGPYQTIAFPHVEFDETGSYDPVTSSFEARLPGKYRFTAGVGAFLYPQIIDPPRSIAANLVRARDPSFDPNGDPHEIVRTLGANERAGGGAPYALVANSVLVAHREGDPAHYKVLLEINDFSVSAVFWTSTSSALTFFQGEYLGPLL